VKHRTKSISDSVNAGKCDSQCSVTAFCSLYILRVFTPAVIVYWKIAFSLVPEMKHSM